MSVVYLQPDTQKIAKDFILRGGQVLKHLKNQAGIHQEKYRYLKCGFSLPSIFGPSMRDV